VREGGELEGFDLFFFWTGPPRTRRDPDFVCPKTKHFHFWLDLNYGGYDGGCGLVIGYLRVYGRMWVLLLRVVVSVPCVR